MIEFSRVSKQFSDPRKQTICYALQDVSLQIGAGELVFLTGSAGAGKSTFLRMIAALERPSSGAVTVQNTDINQLSRHAVPYLRRRIGMILQEPRFLNDRNVLENVRLPLLVSGQSIHEANQRAVVALEKVGLLSRAAACLTALSSTDQQRVALARAIINRPAILLVDAPSAHLEHQISLQLIEVLHDFARAGTTAIIATHDEFLCQQFPARILRLECGKLVQDIHPQPNGRKM